MIANMPAMAIALQKHCIEHVQIQAEEMAMMEMRKQEWHQRTAGDADGEYKS